MDVHDKETRSFNMSKIRSADTKPEVKVRKYLFNKGFRYHKNYKGLPGQPDIVLPKYKTIIFVHGCYWHMHQGCKYFVWPKTNEEFWTKKLIRNQQRDLENYSELSSLDWKVIVVWECELKGKYFEDRMISLIKQIRGNYPNEEEDITL